MRLPGPAPSINNRRRRPSHHESTRARGGVAGGGRRGWESAPALDTTPRSGTWAEANPTFGSSPAARPQAEARVR
jgi:hypothetical protein